jgi:hypothetical protein
VQHTRPVVGRLLLCVLYVMPCSPQVVLGGFVVGFLFLAVPHTMCLVVTGRASTHLYRLVSTCVHPYLQSTCPVLGSREVVCTAWSCHSDQSSSWRPAFGVLPARSMCNDRATAWS